MLPFLSGDAHKMEKKKKKKNGGNFMKLIINVYHLGLVMHMKWKKKNVKNILVKILQ